MKNLIEEFKKFIDKGNVLDLAVGVIIGGAFTTIVNSLVNDVIGPILGVILGGLDFSHIQIPLGGEAYILIGSFIQNIINFLITAFVVFLIVRAFNNLKKKEEVEEKPAEPVESDELKVLKEINKKLNKLK